MREEFLELLRTDRAFREEVRRHLLTEELLALPAQFERLMTLVREAVALLSKLAEVVQYLAEAQARTEKRVERLEERMERVEERVGRLEEAMMRMVEAQARAEERAARMEEAIARLTEAQARMEERADELAQAYVHMQEVMRSLAQQVGQLSHQVGRLSDAVGFALEDLAREVTPAYLAQHYGIRVEELERRFFTIDGQEIEIDLYGEGWRGGEKIVVIGEVRSRIHGRDVEIVVRRASELRPQVSGTPVAVLFGFVIHPSAREIAERLGAIVISSSGR
jgi:DNA repair exonuclease SbcCD ATPase subunit